MENDDKILIAAAAVGAWFGSSNPAVSAAVKDYVNPELDNIESLFAQGIVTLENRTEILEQRVKQYTEPFEVTAFSGLVSNYVTDKLINARWWIKVTNRSDKYALMYIRSIKVAAFDSATSYVSYLPKFEFAPGETKWICVQQINGKRVFPVTNTVRNYISDDGGNMYDYITNGSIFLEYNVGIKFGDINTQYSLQAHEGDKKSLLVRGSIACVKSTSSNDTGKQILVDKGLIR